MYWLPEIHRYEMVLKVTLTWLNSSLLIDDVPILIVDHKIILKNVQRIDVTPEYVQKVIVGEVGRESMELACRLQSSY